MFQNFNFAATVPKLFQNGVWPIFIPYQKVIETKKNHGKSRGFYGCGGRTRTYDLRVMSPTSFQLLYSAIWALLECLYILTQRGGFVKYLFADTFPLKAPQPTALAITEVQKSNMVCSRG